MTPYIHYYTVDVRSGLRMLREKSPTVQYDALADRFVVRMLDGGEKIDLTGVGVSATVIRPDGVTVPVVGSVEDGDACVTLDSECYDVSGDIIITIAITAGEMRQSVLRVLMNVLTRETGGVLIESDSLNVAAIMAIAAQVKVDADRAEEAADRSDAVEVVRAHNEDEWAHPYIQGVITELAKRLAALADSDDTTLDQLSEIVEYIKRNRDLINSITTDKVNVSDIVNDLITNASNKPLSAAQGVELKSLISAKLNANLGAANAGTLLYVSADGTVRPLALGEGLEIADGVLRVTNTQVVRAICGTVLAGQVKCGEV